MSDFDASLEGSTRIEPSISKEILLGVVNTLDDDLFEKANQFKKIFNWNLLHFLLLPLAFFVVFNFSGGGQNILPFWCVVILLTFSYLYLAAVVFLTIFLPDKKMNKNYFHKVKKNKLIKYYLDRFESRDDFVKSYFIQELARNGLYEKSSMNSFEVKVFQEIHTNTKILNNDLDKFYNGGVVTKEVKDVLSKTLFKVYKRCERRSEEKKEIIENELQKERDLNLRKLLSETSKEDLLKYWKE